MTHKIKFKILSCTSQQTNYPSSSLLLNTDDPWQTRRFCTYPQQITLEFYGIANITKLQIVADSRKLPSLVEILYYTPNTQDNKFLKNQHSHKQQKTLIVDFSCLYMRLLFHKPHPTKENFFSQIALYQLNIYANSSPSTLPIETSINSQPTQSRNIYEEDEYVYEKLVMLNSKKQKAIQQEDYEEANTCKLMMDNIKQFGYKLRGMQQVKKKAIDDEDYEKAKSIKHQIQTLKQEIEQILNGAEQENQFADEQMDQFIHKHSISQQPQQQTTPKVDKNHKKPIVYDSYDNRVIPTLAGKLKTQQSQVQPEDNKRQDIPVEQIDGKYLQSAHVMANYFKEQTIKKFFSKYWQNKVEALTTILSEITSKKDQTITRCLLLIVSHTIKDTNLHVSQLSLQILIETLNINSLPNSPHRPPDMANDLDLIIQQISKKLIDNNLKIKTLASKVFQEMSKTNLYGIEACCNALTKNQGKPSAKLILAKLTQLSKMVSKYGVGNNAVPFSVIDYAFSNLENPSNEVRNQSLSLMALCSNTAKEKVNAKMENAKPGIQEQYQQFKQKGSQKPKKKK